MLVLERLIPLSHKQFAYELDVGCQFGFSPYLTQGSDAY